MKGLLGFGLFIVHFNKYRDYYLKIFSTFSSAFITQKLIKIAGDKDNSDLIKLGGYSLTFVEVIRFMSAMKQSGSRELPEADKKWLDGLLGDGVDKILDLIGK